MTDQAVALEAWFAKHHDGGMHPVCFGHGACMAGQAEAEIARLQDLSEAALERVTVLVRALSVIALDSTDPIAAERARAALEEDR